MYHSEFQPILIPEFVIEEISAVGIKPEQLIYFEKISPVLTKNAMRHLIALNTIGNDYSEGGGSVPFDDKLNIVESELLLPLSYCADLRDVWREYSPTYVNAINEYVAKEDGMYNVDDYQLDRYNAIRGLADAISSNVEKNYSTYERIHIAGGNKYLLVVVPFTPTSVVDETTVDMGGVKEFISSLYMGLIRKATFCHSDESIANSRLFHHYLKSLV